MTPRYIIRRLAERDLEEIWTYSYREWGIEQADSYIRGLLHRFTWLGDRPLVGKRRNDVKPGYLCFPEGSHLIFYKVTDHGIDIIGIPHQNMDVLNYFDEI